MKYIFSFLIFATLAFPLLVESLYPKWESSLGGVSRERKFPPLRWESITNGNFQKRFEKWLIGALGVRSLLVKSDNQLNYTLFSQLSSNPRGKAVLGRNGHLLERVYLKRGQGGLAPRRGKLLEKIREIRQLNQALEEQGIKLIVLISANKVATYPELVPAQFRLSDEYRSPYSPRKLLTEEFAKAGISVIDGPQLFTEQRKHFEHQFFSPTGTHWNELGSCLAVSELARLLRENTDSFAGELTCKVDGVRSFPLTMDRDLLSVANIWRPKELIQPAPKVMRTFVPQPDKERPSILFVGTSFLWSFFHTLDKAPFFSHRDMYYYFRRSVPYPRGKMVQINRKDPKWMRRALKREIVVLEVNEAFLHRIGYGFPKRLLEYFRTQSV